MKTILHVCEAFEGGQFYFVSQLSNALCDEFKFVVLHGAGRKATPQDFKSFFPAGTEFIPWNVGRELHPLKDLASLREVRAAISRMKPDLVHSHSSKGGALARLASVGTNVPVIYTPNGYAFVRSDVSGIKRSLYRGLEFVLGRIPHITVACGEAEFRSALRFARKAYFISNTVPLVEPAFPDPTPTRPLLAVMSGRITAQKNFPLFCAIADAARGTNMRFKWIGGGEEVQLRNLPENVEVTGWLSRSQAIDHMAAADVYVQTALWEGLPLTILEAMSYGKPILATNIGPNREVVLQGINGFICSSAEEFAMRLKAFESNRALLNLMGRHSRHIVERRYDTEYATASWRGMYNHYDSYYRA